MARSKLRQGVQIANSELYNDGYGSAHIAGGAEPANDALDIEHDLNVLRTNMKQLKGTDHWYDQVPVTISQEVSTRASADASLTERLSTEESVRASGDTSLTTALSSETSSRVSGDESLTSALSSEASTRASADSLEASVRASADESLTTRLSTEESVSASADVSLTSRLSTEESTRESADSLEASVRASADSLEASVRASADTSLETRLSTEESVSASADVSLTTRLSNEESARASADSLEASVRASADESLTTRLSNEESARASADSLEASVRASADESLTTRLSTEESVSASADVSLTTRISNEESIRASADSSIMSSMTLQLAYNNAPSAEPDIQLSGSDPFSIVAADGSPTMQINNTYFKVWDSADQTPTFMVSEGYVWIDGYLSITGSTLQVNTTVTDADHWLVSPLASTVPAINIKPESAFANDYILIEDSTGKDLFKIDQNGDGYFSGTVDIHDGLDMNNTKITNTTGGTDTYDGVAYWQLSGEASARVSGDLSLTTRVSTEESVRAAADTSLETRLSTEESVSASADLSLTTRLSTEESVRDSADVSLTSALSSEESSRVSGDASLTSALSSETSSRVSGDASLTSALSSEESSRVSGDASLTSALSSETSSRVSGDASLEAKISTEISNEASVRASADLSLTTRLSTEESVRDSADASLTSALSSEESSRVSGDASLTSALSSETSSRVSGDASLTSALSSEESVRASADTSLETRLSTEESVRGAMTLQTVYDQDIDGAEAVIVTNSDDGAVRISGTEKLWIDATSGLDVDTVVDFDLTSFDVNVTGAGFSIDGQGDANVSVSGSGNDLTLESTDGYLWFNSMFTTGNIALSTAATSWDSAIEAVDGRSGSNIGIIDAINAVAKISGGATERGVYVIGSGDSRLSNGGKTLALLTPDRGSLELTSVSSTFRPGRDLEVYVNGQLMLHDVNQQAAGSAAVDDFYLASDELSLNFAFALNAGDVVVAINRKAQAGEDIDTGWNALI
jgi:hypothetical protein